MYYTTYKTPVVLSVRFSIVGVRLLVLEPTPNRTTLTPDTQYAVYISRYTYKALSTIMILAVLSVVLVFLDNETLNRKA